MSAKEMQGVVRDERTEMVENSGYKWAFVFLMYALLIDVGYRGLVRNEAAWDLLALVCVSTFITSVYQARQKALPRGWGRTAVLTALLGGVVAAIAAVLMMHAR